MEHLALTGDRLKRGFAAGSSLFFRRHTCCHILCTINSFFTTKKSSIHVCALKLLVEKTRAVQKLRQRGSTVLRLMKFAPELAIV